MIDNSHKVDDPGGRAFSALNYTNYPFNSGNKYQKDIQIHNNYLFLYAIFKICIHIRYRISIQLRHIIAHQTEPHISKLLCIKQPKNKLRMAQNWLVSNTLMKLIYYSIR